MTLLEIVVTLGIFLIVMTAMLSVFAQALAIERRAASTQAALENMRYVLEIMERSIRQADPATLATSNCTGNVCASLSFTHVSSTKGNVTYSSGESTIQEQSATTGGSSMAITGSSVNIQRLGFIVSGEAVGDGEQPRVTVLFRVSSTAHPTIAADLQTTVTVRTLQE